MKKIIAGVIVLVLVVGAVFIFVPKGNSDGTVSTEKNIRAKQCIRYKSRTSSSCGCLKTKNKKCVKYKTCRKALFGCEKYK